MPCSAHRHRLRQRGARPVHQPVHHQLASLLYAALLLFCIFSSSSFLKLSSSLSYSSSTASSSFFASAYIDHTQFVTSKDVRLRALATHRGNRFVIVYNQTDPRFYYSSQAFDGGQRTEANFAADFEDTRPASFGWNPDASRPDLGRIRGAHYNTFDFPLDGDLVSAGAPTASVPSSGQTLTYPQTVHTNISFYTGPNPPTVSKQVSVASCDTASVNVTRVRLFVLDITASLFCRRRLLF
jgi:hypothetical protein